MLKEKAIIIFTVAIDVLGLGIIIPVLPTYVESFGFTAFNVTTLFSIYSFFSFLSAPFLGALSDKIGRRPVFIASIASTSLGWFVFALGKSFPILVLGRIIDGLAAGNFSIAQSAISDLSKDSKERASNLGLLGMIFGFGFILGPFFGGLLSVITYSAPFIFVGILALINTILAILFLPETNKNIDKSKKLKWNPFAPLIMAVKNKNLRKLYLVTFLFNLTAVAGNSVFALYLAEVYKFDAFTAGLFFTVVGIILALNQGFLVRKFWLIKFTENTLIPAMLVLFFVGSLIISVPIIGLFVLGMVITALGQSTLGVALTSKIVGVADVKERGQATGIISSVGSLATIIAPILAGALFQIKPNLPYLTGAVLTLIALFIIKQHKQTAHKNKAEYNADFVEEPVI